MRQVSVQAEWRLRSKLRDYYASDGKNDPIHFSLPKGHYAPVVTFADKDIPDAPRQQIRFLKTKDQTTLAYAESGGGFLLVKVANWLSHLEYDCSSPIWKHWWTDLSNQYRLIRYDERGCGLSDWDASGFSFEAWVEDLEQVVDQVDGITRSPAVTLFAKLLFILPDSLVQMNVARTATKHIPFVLR